MKWMVASDIHGSAKYCRELLDAYEREKADRLLLLGDLLYHGPRNDLPEEYDTKKVVKLLSAVKDKIVCVRGNCEAEVDQMVLPFPCLADYALFPYVYGDENGEKFSDLFLTHGHLYSAENPPLLNAGDVLLNPPYGTHAIANDSDEDVEMRVLVIEAFNMFESIFVMTQGGPLGSTSTIMYYIYEQGFTNYNMGYASALAWIFFAIIMVVTLIQYRFRHEQGGE